MTLERAIKRNSFLICIVCGKSFLNRWYEKEIKKGNAKFCSKKCQSLHYSQNHRKGDYCICEQCGRIRYYSPSTIKRTKRVGICGNCRKKEKTMSTDGYWEIRVPEHKHKIKEHRYFMEKKIGRKLLSTELVHHINGKKLDNRIENLEIMSRAEHNILHQPNGFNPKRFKN
jgi:hypothetical protein